MKVITRLSTTEDAEETLRDACLRGMAVSWFRAFVLMLAAGSFCILAAETIDRVLAVVAGQIITLSDVTAARALGLQSSGNATDPVRVVLSKLMDRELVLAEVERYAPPEPAADALDREIDGIRARFPSAEAFTAALAQSGLDERRLREIVRQDLRIRAYQDQRFAAADPARRQTLIDEWVAGLRRRTDIIDLYIQSK
jgi:hypothetical protein